MSALIPPAITIAVEGIGDEAAARKLIEVAGLESGEVYIANGKSNLDLRLKRYNHAARHAPWLVLRDLDHDATCAPELRPILVPEPAALLLLRIPVRSLESWLLADRSGIAKFLAVPQERVAPDPEALDRPKRALVDLARGSRSKAIRQDMAPAEGTSSEVGPGYTSRLIEFSSRFWDPVIAARNSPSLKSCLAALQRLREL